MLEGTKRKFVFVPAFLFATPIQSVGSYGYQLKLPLSSIPMLADLPVCEDVLAPIQEYRYHGQGIPSICLAFSASEKVEVENPFGVAVSIENSTHDECPTISVMAQKIPGVGYFPALYGLQCYIENDWEYDEEELRDLYGHLETGEYGFYFHCYSEATRNSGEKNDKPLVNELLHTERLDYLIAGTGVGKDFVVWDRIKKSLGIWLDGHSTGYKDCAFDCINSGDDL